MLKYLLSFLLISSTLLAQEVKQDTVIASSDSLKIKVDMLKIKSDTLKIKFDTTGVFPDSLKPEVKYDTLSYSEEYKRDYWRTFFGGRFGLSQSRFRIDENFVDRQGLNGLPILDEKGEIVKNSFINNPGSNTGFNGGLFFRFVRGSFYVQPELIYSVKAGRFDILNKDLSLYKRVNGALGSIDIPVLIGVRTKNSRVFFGPTTNFAFRMNKNLRNALSEFSEPQTLNKSFYNRPILNFQVGVGYELKGYFIDIRYERGLNPYTNQKIGPSSSPQTFNLQSDGIFISIGILGR
jgi:Outer membrane protein beta-barrel domain